jgi:hypothetical protein
LKAKTKTLKTCYVHIENIIRLPSSLVTLDLISSLPFLLGALFNGAAVNWLNLMIFFIGNLHVLSYPKWLLLPSLAFQEWSKNPLEKNMVSNKLADHLGMLVTTTAPTFMLLQTGGQQISSIASLLYAVRPKSCLQRYQVV